MSMVWISILEVAAVAAVVVALFCEERIARLEERLFAAIRRRRLKMRKGEKKVAKAS